MSDYIVKDTELTSVANAIRTKGGTNSQLVFPSGFVSAIGNISGGGGQATVLFDGSVTTEAQQIGEPTGTIEGLTELTADTIKVTFDGTEYTCEKVDDGYGDSTFTEYPFFIDSWQGSVLLHTETAGTYTLKIEEEQSGGSSDFSTAEVTLINNRVGNAINLIAPTYIDDEEISTSTNYINAQPNETVTQNAFLYKNSCFAEIQGFELIQEPVPTVTVSGNVVYEGDGFFTITGDCTITIS